jgi:uncharacterized protein (DUF488 family)
MPTDEMRQRVITNDDLSGLFTVGYQRRTPESLAALLASRGIKRLVDVRYVAFSRKRGFSASALMETMRKSGIVYEHWRELGNPPEIRDLYKAGHVEEGRRQFRLLLANGRSVAIDRLVELAGQESVAILCLEADHRLCHRDVVAEAAAERATDLVVTHL